MFRLGHNLFLWWWSWISNQHRSCYRNTQSVFCSTSQCAGLSLSCHCGLNRKSPHANVWVWFRQNDLKEAAWWFWCGRFTEKQNEELMCFFLNKVILLCLRNDCWVADIFSKIFASCSACVISVETVVGVFASLAIYTCCIAACISPCMTLTFSVTETSFHPSADVWNDEIILKLCLDTLKICLIGFVSCSRILWWGDTVQE